MEDKIEVILEEIKKKQELKNLDDGFVLNQIYDFLSLPKNKKIKDKIKAQPINHLLRSKEVKELIKGVRAQARLEYGMFKTSQSKWIRERMHTLKLALKKHEFDAEASKDLHKKILVVHKSSYERVHAYESLYKELFKRSMVPKSILDLGCGINPVSQVFMNIDDLEYHARELAQEDCNELREYYKLANLKGTVEQADLTKEQEFPKVDMVFLFKILDVIEHQKRGVTKYLLDTLQATYIIASFATRSLGGKMMKTQRTWFHYILDELKLEYQTYEISNELFFIIKKSKRLLIKARQPSAQHPVKTQSAA